MRLKAITTLSLLLGMFLLLLSPWVYQQRPGLHGNEITRRELGAFQVMFAGYIGATICTFMLAACLSALLIRQAKDEFARLATENVRGLVEGSLEDLRSREKSEPTS